MGKSYKDYKDYDDYDDYEEQDSFVPIKKNQHKIHSGNGNTKRNKDKHRPNSRGMKFSNYSR